MDNYMNNFVYPFVLLDTSIAALHGGKYKGLPIYIDMSVTNPHVKRICSEHTQNEFEKYVQTELQQHQAEWGLSGYLENRTTLLSKYPQMVETNRVFHLGLDVILPAHSAIYTPIDATVVWKEYEAGAGNYGGLIVLQHCLHGLNFYTLYGHLKYDTLPEISTVLSAGTKLAELGSYTENGNWFQHTHLQVLTELGYQQGWIHKGYCSPEDLPNIKQYCPDPSFLLR